MAEGLRVMSADPMHAGKTIVIQDHSRIMGHNGQPKTYAIPLDNEASAIVSETVWGRLQAIMAVSPDMPTLILVGSVAEPPAMHAGNARERPTLLWTPTGEQVGIAPIAVPASS